MTGAPRERMSIHDRNPVDVADAIADLLVRENRPPAMFKMGGTVALLSDGVLVPFDPDRWLYHVAQRVDFSVPTKEGAKLVAPPHHAMRMVPAAVIDRLPVLDGLVHTPYLDHDGNIVDADGYNPDTRLVLLSNGQVDLPKVPASPTTRQLTAAVRLLLDEWLSDFPFDRPASQANAAAVLLTVTGRAFFSLAPLFVIDASTSGAGKGLLASTCGIIHTGRAPHLLELPADGEEQRKKITTALLSGEDLLVWDETQVVHGRSLAMVLTAETYSDRLLGGNKLITVPNHFTQLALGNNVQVWGDNKRRVVPIRLEPEEEHPEKRNDFRHPHLEEWVRGHRGALLAAAFTIWRAWIAKGRPRGKTTMGSFNGWAQVVGGALEVAEIKGFLDGTEEWLDFSETEGDGWIDHLRQLCEYFEPGKPFRVAEVVDLNTRGRIEIPYVRRDPDRGYNHAVANAYRSIRGRWIGDCRLESSATRAAANGARLWTVYTRASWAEVHER